MDCQLEDLPEAGSHLSLAERAIRYVARKAISVATNPGAVMGTLRGRHRRTSRIGPPDGGVRRGSHLYPGDLVRVKGLADITATLDAEDRFEGLAFMVGIMDRYCGGQFRVKKRVDRFFDERGRRMAKLRDVVILDDVFCEPPLDSTSPWAGCARTCFLFWKEVWLERVSEADTTPDDREC